MKRFYINYVCVSEFCNVRGHTIEKQAMDVYVHAESPTHALFKLISEVTKYNTPKTQRYIGALYDINEVPGCDI